VAIHITSQNIIPTFTRNPLLFVLCMSLSNFATVCFYVCMFESCTLILCDVCPLFCFLCSICIVFILHYCIQMCVCHIIKDYLLTYSLLSYLIPITSYTVNDKKRAALFLITTMAFWVNFYTFCTSGNMKVTLQMS